MDIEEFLTKLLNEKKLKQNFNKHISVWNPVTEPEPAMKEKILNFPVTHTFSDEIKIDDFKTYFPYKEILFKNKAVLSQYSRRLSTEKAPESSFQILGKANNYPYFVYTYLGSHDHYYSRVRGEEMPSPAFGIFISKDAEYTKFSNSTRVDLSSPESIEEKEKEFLTSTGGRIYTAYQIANRLDHKNDFFHYCGDYQIAKKNGNYLRNCSKWKTEFHFLYKVDITNISAILWPYKILHTLSGLLVDPITLNEINDLKRVNSQIKVYPYQWKNDKPQLRFIYASNIILRSIYESGIYPTDVLFAKEFKKEFKE